ncbi:MAG: PAS domain-containing protein [Candidatus Aureabacteria bacterium]|nr:PAS domain-containing protein [Candidatus Auribacterota bacterium]
MTLRAKILATFGGMLLCMVAVFYSASRTILLDSFEALEEQRIVKNLDRVRDALAAEVEQLDFITRDWAWWDETCAYIADRNEAFERMNLNDVTLAALKIDAIAFMDPEGRIVQAIGFDRLAGVKAPFPEAIARHLSPDSPLLAHRSRDDRAAGIVMLASGPVLVATRPVLTGEGSGPIRGALLMARSLDEERGREIASLTHVEFTFLPFDAPDLPVDFRLARASFAGAPGDLVRPLDGGTLGGYRMLPDLYGAPALILRVQELRDIHARGLDTLQYLVLSMLAVGFVFSAGFVLVLERLLLSPLGRLTTRVDAIGSTGDLSSRVILGGRDELSRLAGSINGMLVALERTQEVLKRSEEDFRCLFENMLTGFAYHRIVTDQRGEATDFVFIEVNHVFEKLTRLRREAILGRKASEVMPGIVRDAFDWMSLYGKVALTGETARVERYSVFLNRWYSLSAYSPRKGYFAILFDDITERKESEKRLYMLGMAVAQSIDGIAVTDPSGVLTFANASWAAMYGYGAEERPGKPFAAFFPPGQGAREMELFKGRVETGGAHQEEVRQARKDGSVFHAWMSGTLLRDDKGDAVGGMLIVRDITGQKLVEQALRKTQRQQKALLDGIPDTAWLKDTESRYIAVNEPFARTVGARPDELIGKNDFDVWPQDRAERYRRDDVEVMSAGKRVCIEEPSVNLSGARTWLETIKAPVYDYEGRVIGTVGISRDITERKRAEKRMEHLTRVLRALRGADHLITREKNRAKLIGGACASLVTHRGYINAWAVLLGNSGEVREAAESGVGPDFAGLVERIRRGDLPDCGRRALEGDEPVIVVDPPSACPSCPLAGGYHRKGAMTVRLGYGGRVYGLLSVGLPADFSADEEECALFGELARDIAFALHGIEIEEARSRAEEALRTAARDLRRSNQELEQFAYVASHDLQEPLRMVTSYLQLLDKRYGALLGGDAAEFIRFAVEGAGHMKGLISGLLEYSRLGTGASPRAPIDCGAALDRALANLAVAISESRGAVTRDPLPVVAGNEQELGQLFQNLIGNAVRFKSAVPPRIHVSARREGAEWLFSVRDNGIGIEPRFAERIFVIFQRLHGRDEYPGTGIGLALCRKIVERHGGRIWVESQPGRGATFFFTIPAEGAHGGGRGA